jgi:putative ABC transport system ATP-binding protein
MMIASAEELIRLRDIGKVFETEEITTHALAKVELRIARGEFVAIAGPSGCGKTTLLAILGLLDSPSSGTYQLEGMPVEKLGSLERARLRRERIGFIFQTFNLIGELSVQENVELPLRYRGVAPAERRKRSLEALERVGLAHRVRHMPSQLSGGQQQRVAVARAVVGQPSILLADEPTGNLDSENGAEVMQLLGDLHKGGTTLCMVTHDPRFARAAGRTVHLLDGQVVGEPAARQALS